MEQIVFDVHLSRLLQRLYTFFSPINSNMAEDKVLPALRAVIDEMLAKSPPAAYKLANSSKYLAERLVENPGFSAKDMVEGLKPDETTLLEAAKNRGLLTFFPAPDRNHKVLPNDLYTGIFFRTRPPGWPLGVNLDKDPAWQRRKAEGKKTSER